MQSIAKAIAVITLISASSTAFAATEVTSAPAGEHDMGTISASICKHPS